MRGAITDVIHRRRTPVTVVELALPEQRLVAHLVGVAMRAGVIR